MTMSDKEQSTATTITQLVELSNVDPANKAPSVGQTIKATENAEHDTEKSVFEEPAPEEITPEKIVDDNISVDGVEILARLKAENMLVPGSGLSYEFQDNYRRIKRPLVSNAFGRGKKMVDRGNLILVTSSIPGEGKTHTSINLALSISQELDNTVLLVDCDVMKQGVSRMLGVNGMAGLVDVLENDDLGIGDVLLQTDIPNLRVMPAGKQNEYVTELLASKRMAALVDELVNRYTDRVIIFDGPPLLPTPQAQVLAEMVGQVVFVIEAGKTPQALVEEALAMIPSEQATGLVMNKNQGLTKRASYGYGYYGPDND